MIADSYATFSVLKVILYLLRHLLNFKRIYRFWPKRTIVIYGESGAGKTQFIRSLTGDDRVVESRTQDIRRYTWIMPDYHRVELIDTPGQMSLKEIRQRLNREFTKKKIFGVINIVTNGYLINTDTQLSEVFTADNPSQVKPGFLQDNKERELKQIDEWMSNIHAENKVKWFMTVVNKADIWYSEIDNVMDYYRSGAYHDKVQGLNYCCRRVVAFAYCSIISPFGNRPMLLTMSEHKKREMTEELIRELTELNFGKA